MNPADMAAESLAEGDSVTLRSAHGSIPARVKADELLRPGVISIPHGFGGLPGQLDYDNAGSNTNLLLSSGSERASINAMPRMSGIGLNIEKTRVA